MWVHHTPSGVCPQNCWWGCPEREQIFSERWQRLSNRDKPMKHAANFVAFIQLAPHWQKSVTCTDAFEAAKKRRMGGAIHRREVAGFSVEAGARMCRQANGKLAVKRALTLPMLMEA